MGGMKTTTNEATLSNLRACWQRAAAAAFRANAAATECPGDVRAAKGAIWSGLQAADARVRYERAASAA